VEDLQNNILSKVHRFSKPHAVSLKVYSLKKIKGRVYQLL